MESYRFVYLSSSARSGSTLLALLLGAHPDIATIGELTGPARRGARGTKICSCGVPLEECEFYERIASGMQSRGHQFQPLAFETRIVWGENTYLRQFQTGSLESNFLERLRDVLLSLWPDHRKRIRYLIERNIAIIETILEITGKCVFLDTSKDHMRIKYFHNFAYTDLYVIHLVRDPRGVATSWFRTKNRTAADAAHRWVRENKNIRRQLKRLPKNRHILIRYEDLCKEPQATLLKLYKFLKVQELDIIPNFRKYPHHVIGNKMRKGSPSEIKLDLRWKTELSNDQQDRIKRIVYPYCTLFGYMT